VVFLDAEPHPSGADRVWVVVNAKSREEQYFTVEDVYRGWSRLEQREFPGVLVVLVTRGQPTH
jgi:hypothetical protein